MLCTWWIWPPGSVDIVVNLAWENLTVEANKVDYFIHWLLDQ